MGRGGRALGLGRAAGSAGGGLRAGGRSWPGGAALSARYLPCGVTDVIIGRDRGGGGPEPGAKAPGPPDVRRGGNASAPRPRAAASSGRWCR